MNEEDYKIAIELYQRIKHVIIGYSLYEVKIELAKKISEYEAEIWNAEMPPMTSKEARENIKNGE